MEDAFIDDEEGLRTKHTIRLSCPTCGRLITAQVCSSPEEIETLDLECTGAETLRAPGDVSSASPHAPTLLLLESA